MSRRVQLLMIGLSVIALTSLFSHLTAHFLNIRTDVIDRGKINADAPGGSVLVLGSSLTFFDVSFRDVGKILNRPIATRGVGGCSPCELEPLAQEVPAAARTIIGISLFDLNENNLCDARPSLVPFPKTARDLWSSHADWHYAKRVIWSYPMPWLQKVIPVAGRSTTVMVNLRDKARGLLARQPLQEETGTLSFNTEDDTDRPEKLSDWDEGRISRNLSQIGASGLGHGGFRGPKSLALGRILARASHREPTVVLVLPVSPPYRNAFCDRLAVAEFEQAIGRMRAHDPRLQIIRVDQNASLQSAEVFWDLVHLNDAGRRIATRLVTEQLSPVSGK